jgi:hypothetical protein
MSTEGLVGPTLTQFKTTGKQYGNLPMAGPFGSFTFDVTGGFVSAMTGSQASLQRCPTCGRSHTSVAAPQSLEEVSMLELVRAISDVRVSYTGGTVVVSRPSQPGSLFAIADISEPQRKPLAPWLDSPFVATLAAGILNAFLRRVRQRAKPRRYEDWDAIAVAPDSGLNAYAFTVLRTFREADEEVW